nr:MAG TPA_asm: hypothetical protein [Caudoviricetes sp.]
MPFAALRAVLFLWRTHPVNIPSASTRILFYA